MSCKSALYTVNNTNTTITATTTTPAQIPFGSIIRRFGKYVNLEGGSIFCCDSGYFKVNCSITITPAEAGIITAQIYQDGIPIPGAFASATATADGTINLSIDTLIRNCGCNCNSVITLTIDADSVINNISTVIEKL